MDSNLQVPMYNFTTLSKILSIYNKTKIQANPTALSGAGACICYLEMWDELQKRISRTVGPSLAGSIEPLVCHWNIASLSLFYRYYFGRCSSELPELLPHFLF